jgi:hypothetical protein
MSDKIFLIGNDEGEFGKYKSDPSDPSNLPLKSLPMSYFPFFYANNEASLEKLRKLVPMLENYSSTLTASDDKTQAQNAVKYTIDTDKLLSLLSELEQPYQPYNTYNITHIYGIILLFWLIVTYLVLLIVHSFTGTYYMYVILASIVLLCILGICLFFITNSTI